MQGCPGCPEAGFSAGVITNGADMQRRDRHVAAEQGRLYQLFIVKLTVLNI